MMPGRGRQGGADAPLINWFAYQGEMAEVRFLNYDRSLQTLLSKGISGQFLSKRQIFSCHSFFK